MQTINIKHLGQVEYQTCWQAMRDFTEMRNKDTTDELWLVEHPPVFTFGQAGKPEHLLDAHGIEVVNSDRGGQVTYHGPGQIVVYCLLDIRRLGIGARALVDALETSIIQSLSTFQLKAFAKKEAPGVYIGQEDLEQSAHSARGFKDAKIAALGLRIRKGCSYHGLSLNLDMNLEPFTYINPCGYEGQAVCQLSDFTNQFSKARVETLLYQNLCQQLKLVPTQE